MNADGELEKLSYSRDGSYIVFTLDNGGSLVYARRSGAESDRRPLYIGGGALAAAAVTACCLALRKKRKKTKVGNSNEA